MNKPSVIKQYLDKQSSLPLTAAVPVGKNLRLIVVIPCYNEPDVLNTLESLSACNRRGFGVEIILLINSYEFNDNNMLEINRLSFEKSRDFATKHNDSVFTLIPVLVEGLPGNQSGAGLPRKIGMDEALRRFDRIGVSDGIICCLDADCTVDRNYIEEICVQFEKQKLCSATIEFHHPVEHLPENDPLREAATLYELYLRYYRAAMEYCGYPYAYYTIGSAMAVTCDTYARAGGMGKQEAGEDFYFLQKVFPLGNTMLIDTTRIYPAARLSDRVPFGTGPELGRMSAEKEIVKYSYCVEAFYLLKLFFNRIGDFFKIPQEACIAIIQELPDPIRNFILEDHFDEKIREINQNTSNPEAFRKRFFNYFNAFKILKYLNFVHPAYFELGEVREQYKILLKKTNGNLTFHVNCSCPMIDGFSNKCIYLSSNKPNKQTKE